MIVELAAEPRVVQADECEHQRVRDRRGRLVWDWEAGRGLGLQRLSVKLVMLSAARAPPRG